MKSKLTAALLSALILSGCSRLSTIAEKDSSLPENTSDSAQQTAYEGDFTVPEAPDDAILEAAFVAEARKVCISWSPKNGYKLDLFKDAEAMAALKSLLTDELYREYLDFSGESISYEEYEEKMLADFDIAPEDYNRYELIFMIKNQQTDNISDYSIYNRSAFYAAWQKLLTEPYFAQLCTNRRADVVEIYCDTDGEDLRVTAYADGNVLFENDAASLISILGGAKLPIDTKSLYISTDLITSQELLALKTKYDAVLTEFINADGENIINAEEIAENLPELEKLSIHTDSNIYSFLRIAEMEKLRELELSHTVTSPYLLYNCKSLRTLTLSGCSIDLMPDPENLEELILTDCTVNFNSSFDPENLRSLTITDCSVEGLGNLADCCSLDELYIKNCSLSSADDYKELSVLYGLKKLTIENSGLKENTYKQLMKNLPNCKITAEPEPEPEPEPLPEEDTPEISYDYGNITADIITEEVDYDYLKMRYEVTNTDDVSIGNIYEYLKEKGMLEGYVKLMADYKCEYNITENVNIIDGIPDCENTEVYISVLAPSNNAEVTSGSFRIVEPGETVIIHLVPEDIVMNEVVYAAAQGE